MKNLKVWQKLGILGVVFAIPFAIVTGKLIANNAKSQLGTARMEIAGIELYRPILKLIQHLQHHRDLTAAAAGSEPFFKNSLSQKQQDVEDALKNAAAAANVADEALSISGRWRTTELVCRQALLSSESPAAAYQNHTDALGKLISMVHFIGDASGLNQDIDRDHYYLMEALQFKGTETVELLSRARAAASAIIVQKSGTPENEWKILDQINTQLDRLLGTTDASLSSSLKQAIELNPKLQPRLDKVRASVEESGRASLELLHAFTKAKNTDLSATDLYGALTLTIDGVFNLQDRTATALVDLLQEDITGFRWDMIKTLLLAVAGMGIAGLIAWFIIRDITNPLEQLVAVADRVASGNLSVNIPFENRRDEIGVLVSSFNGMIFSLTSIVSQVQKSGLQVNTSINQISVTGKEQQTAAQEIAGTTTNIGNTANEISSTSRELLTMMNDAFSVAEETTGLAGKGKEGLSRMRGTMDQITDAVSLVHTKLDVLNQKATNINQVITTITKIADRTNLLSLNAAIEAEKAGEYGRGFSVVATEIRRLADQTAVATYDIEQMVNDMQDAVTTGVVAMNRFSDQVKQGVRDVQQISTQLDQIINQVQALPPRFELVNQGMQSQASGGQQISDSLSQLSRTVQQTARSLEQSNEAIEQLKNAAYGLRDGVARFKLPR